MNLHREIHFEDEICADLAAAAWLHTEGDAAATTALAPSFPLTCWPGCRPLSRRPGLL